MSDMWMPPHTTWPPFFTARKAAGTSAPTGAKMIAASSSCGGAETVDAEALACSGHPVAAPPDQSRAHERRQRGDIGIFRQCKAIARIGHRVGRKAAVPG